MTALFTFLRTFRVACRSANAEAQSRFPTTVGSMAVLSDTEAVEETYQHYAVKVMRGIPCPTTKGIQMVLGESRAPKAKNYHRTVLATSLF
jgi:hypothetical protein